MIDFKIAVSELHAFGTELRIVLDQPFDQLDIVIIAVNGQIIFAVDVNLNFKEGFEIFDVSVVCSKKFGDPVADPNAFLHPAFQNLRSL